MVKTIRKTILIFFVQTLIVCITAGGCKKEKEDIFLPFLLLQNGSTASVEIPPNEIPYDLEVSAVGTPLMWVTSVEPFDIYYTVTNLGAEDVTADFDVQIRLSLDTDCTNADYLAGTDTITATVTGNGGSIDITAFVITATGIIVGGNTHYVCAMVDSGDVITESNELNNIGVSEWPVLILLPPS